MKPSTIAILTGIGRKIIMDKGAVKATELATLIVSKLYEDYKICEHQDIDIGVIFSKILEDDKDIKEHPYMTPNMPYREKSIFVYWPED